MDLIVIRTNVMITITINITIDLVLTIPEVSVMSPLHIPHQASHALQPGDVSRDVLEDCQSCPPELLQTEGTRLNLCNWSIKYSQIDGD